MIWSYWEGPTWHHIDTCIASMQSVFGSDFVLVTPKTLYDYLPEDAFHPNFSKIPQPAVKAGCIRAALLAEHGGWWMDADTIAVNHPKNLHLSYPSAKEIYTVWDKPPTRVLNGYIYFSSKSNRSSAWLEGVNRLLVKGPDLPWCAPGEGILTKLLYQASGSIQVPRKRFLPIDIDSYVVKFFGQDTTDFGALKDPDTICFGLNHSYFVYHHRKEMVLPPESWSKSSLLVHRLLNWARGMYQ